MSVQVIVSVQLPDETYQRLAAVAKARQIAVAKLANEIVTDYVEERLRDA